MIMKIKKKPKIKKIKKKLKKIRKYIIQRIKMK
jgi:hypothetical protein